MSEPAPDQPGARMAAEIAEQPGAFYELLANRTEIATIAARLAERRPRFVLLAARGSSGHATLYAKYLVEVLLELPVGLVSPSTTTLYGARPDLTDVLLVTVSQSGGSPDLVEVTESARRRGASTVAVTNTADSPLNSAAEFSVDIRAGREGAVAATKSYSATLLALYLLVDAARGGTGEEAARLPELAERALRASTEAVDATVQRYRFADHVVTTGRGYSSATADEAALKLAETSYLSTRAYGGADLLHGPVAAVDSRTAVLALCSQGQGGSAMREVLDTVRQRGADTCVIGSATAEVPATQRIDVPACAEELAPVLPWSRATGPSSGPPSVTASRRRCPDGTGVNGTGWPRSARVWWSPRSPWPGSTPPPRRPSSTPRSRRWTSRHPHRSERTAPDRHVAGSPGRRISTSTDRRCAGSTRRWITTSPDRRVAPDRQQPRRPRRARISRRPGGGPRSWRRATGR